MQAVMIAGTVMSAVGSVVSGYSQAAAMQAQAQGLQHEATIAEANARNASRTASLREEQARREGRQEMGARAAAIAESGAGFGGSNLHITRQSAALQELDALNVRYEGAVQRTSLMNQAQGLRYQAQTAKQGAKHAVIGGWIGAGSAALGGVSNYGKTFGFGRGG